MGSAGSSLASSERDFALAEKTRPAGCPKDPLVFKPSNASPRLAGVVPYMLAYRRYVQALYGPERLPEERPKQGKEASRVRTITA